MGGEDHGDGEHGGEGHIGGGGVGEADHADGGGQEEQEPASGFGAVEAQGEPGQGESGEERGNGAGQAGGSFAYAKELEAERGAPIVKWWLFKPGFAVEARGDVIAGFLHVAGDPSVARFVGTNEADGAEIMEVTKVESGEDQDEPQEARWEREGCGGGEFGGVLGHGKRSLALSVYLGRAEES